MYLLLDNVLTNYRLSKKRFEKETTRAAVRTGKRLHIEFELLNDLLSESSDMQKRSKFLILLFTVTLAVGALTWPASEDYEAVEDFRSLFSTSTVYELKHSMPSVPDPSSLAPVIDLPSLVYGGISLFAIILIVLVIRAARRAVSNK